jgi:ABC-type amino acid transport substrate-binding protein
MRTFRLLSFFFIALLVVSCSCAVSRRPTFRIGVDPNWYPLNFEAFQPYVNGFTEDLLLEISKYAGVNFVKVEANWDSLLDGLHEKQYDAVLTSMPSYNFNKVKYSFSKNFLDLGPVLIIPANAQLNDLSKLSNEVVGIVKEDPAFLILQKYPEIIVRKYETVPELLKAVVTGSLEGALLDRLVASSFVRDMYPEQLKISTGPLTDFGLHVMSLKSEDERLIDLFDRTLAQLKKQKKLQALQTKWQL